MKDSNGNKISIGDRVKVLWNFVNKFHTGKIIEIKDNLITIHSSDNPKLATCYRPKITTSDHSRITKMLGRTGENTDK